MQVEIFMPGFGLDVIDLDTLKLQPWNYLLQIAKNLVEQGYKVALTIIDVEISLEAKNSLAEEGIIVQPFNKHTMSDTVIVPIAIGFLSKLINSLPYVRHREIIGVLTTPLIDMQTLWINYVKVKLSKTSVVADALLYENILFRLRTKLLCNCIRKLIVPSNDYSEILLRILPCDMDITTFIPEVSIPASIRDKAILSNNTGEIIISYFGPFSEERGVISLIKAFKKVRDYPIRMQLLIRDIGSGRIDLIDKLVSKVSNKIEVHIGNISKEELFSKLILSDLIILPYRIMPSTIPLAYLEAIMLNKPLVIASNVPGINEHLKKYFSLRIRPTYTVNELSSIVIKLIEERTILNESLDKQQKYVQELKQKYAYQKVVL